MSPGTELTVDLVGVGPMRAVVRWAQAGKFGIQFGQNFDLAMLAQKKDRPKAVTTLKPWYVARQAS